ncbi:PH domain-containing protein [Hymenobacter daeguensis]
MPASLPECRAYYLAKGWRIFMCVAAPLLILLLVGMPLLWWLEKPMPLYVALYCLLPLGFGLLFLYGLAEAIWGRVVLTPEGITEVSTLGRRQLAWVEIKGYRISRNYLRLLPADTRRRSVKIGLLTDDISKIIDWVAEYYPNLGPAPEQPAAGPRLVPFASPEMQTAHDRQLAEAQQTARLLNYASWGAAAWLLFYPVLYQLAITASLLLPVAAVAAQWLYPGLLRPDEPDAAPAPALGVALIIPGAALFIRMALDITLVSTAAIQPWAFGVGGGLALLLVLGSRQHLFGREAAFGQGVIILLAAALYGYSAPVAYNTAFDANPATDYTPALLAKRINPDELPGFKAQVQPWGPFSHANELLVGRAHYHQLQPGDRVRVRLMPGELGIAWFKVIAPTDTP